MGCGHSSLPPDSPGQQDSSQSAISSNSSHNYCYAPPAPQPPYHKGPPSPSSPSYNDPFAFFIPTERSFDNTADPAPQASGGLLGLMEGLASCKKTGSGSNVPPEKAFNLQQEAAKISGSQIDFFKMLDERIENGPDDECAVEMQRRLYDRCCSTTQEGATPPQQPPNRRWSASKITNPRTPTSPDEQPKFTFIRHEHNSRRKSVDHHFSEGEEEDECLLNEASVEATDQWSPSSSSSESHKEQYMFLGNVYTLTRSKNVARGNSSDITEQTALVAVTPAALTEEDLHVRIENGVHERNCANEKTLGGETSKKKCEVEQFWMDLEMNNHGVSSLQRQLHHHEVDIPRITKSIPSDIVRGALLPLRTVIE